MRFVSKFMHFKSDKSYVLPLPCLRLFRQLVQVAAYNHNKGANLDMI